VVHIEVEIKVKLKDHDQAKEVLEKIGEHRKTVRQIDTYYVPAHKDYFKKLPAEEFCRIRVQPDKATVEYHRVMNLGKENEYGEEYEVKIDDATEMMQLLEHMDFKKAVVVDKTRNYWHCDKFEIVVDHIEGLGNFLEVEVISSTKEVGITKDDCLKFLDDNGIEYEEQVFDTYPELILKK